MSHKLRLKTAEFGTNAVRLYRYNSVYAYPVVEIDWDLDLTWARPDRTTAREAAIFTLLTLKS